MHNPKHKPKKKIYYKKKDSGGRFYWTGLVWVNEDDLSEEGKMRFRLGDLYPENKN